MANDPTLHLKDRPFTPGGGFDTSEVERYVERTTERVNDLAARLGEAEQLERELIEFGDALARAIEGLHPYYTDAEAALVNWSRATRATALRRGEGEE